MAVILAFLLTLICSVMVGALLTNQTTVLLWLLALLVTLGLTLVALHEAISKSDSSPGSNATGSGSGKTKR